MKNNYIKMDYDKLKLMKNAYEHFYNLTGPQYQVVVAQGELFELGCVLSEYQRILLRGEKEYNLQERGQLSELIGEIADVKNVIFGLENHLGITKQVEETQISKIERTINRFNITENGK